MVNCYADDLSLSSSLMLSNTYFSSGSLDSLSINPLTICLVVLSAAPCPLCCILTTYSYTKGLMYNEHTSPIQLNSVFVVLSFSICSLLSSNIFQLFAYCKGTMF